MPPPFRSPQGREHGIRLSSHMERYGDTYTLVIANADKIEDRWDFGGWGAFGAVASPPLTATASRLNATHFHPPTPHHPTNPTQPPTREVKLDTSVSSYFHADGYLAEPKFRSHVQKLLSQYELIDKAHEGSRPKALNPKKQR
jgi:hypothetical protein